MEESFLLRAAVVCSIIGVIALYLISGRIDAGEADISRITSGQADGDVSVSGRVARMTEKDSFMIIELEKEERIDVFLFKNSHVLLNEGDYVEVRGSVDEYEGEKEIIADEIRVV